MDAPEARGEIDRSIRESSSRDRLYNILRQTALSRVLFDVGKLHWRVVMLVGVLAVLFVPLSRALNHVREETVARAAVRDAVRQLAAREDIVSQTVDLSSETTRVRLITTGSVPAERVEQARRSIIRRTGRDAELFVRKVAGEEELAVLRDQLKPAPAPPPPQDLESIRLDLVPRLEKPLAEIWPSSLGAVTSYELGFTPSRLVVRLKYQAEKPLDEGAAAILQKSLQSRLRVEQLGLELEHVAPAPEPAPVQGRS
jgi:hypothetical protein